MEIRNAEDQIAINSNRNAEALPDTLTKDNFRELTSGKKLVQLNKIKHSPSFWPNVFLHASHLQLIVHPTPLFVDKQKGPYILDDS